MNSFYKKGPDYYGLFINGISIACRAAKCVQKSLADGAIDKKEIEVLKEIEHEGDRQVHESMSLISEAFITPINNTDMMDLVNAIENITDSINEIGNQIYMMHITQSNAVIDNMVSLIVQGCEKLMELLSLFKHYQKNIGRIKELIVDVNQLEEQSDHAYNEGMRCLFDPAENNPPIDVIRLQNLYKTLENSLDACEDVADIVDRVIIVNS